MIDSRLAPGALTPRLALGIMFIAHAYLKLTVLTVPGFAEFLTQVGLWEALAWPIILAELLGGVAVLLGLHARVASLLLLPVLLNALYAHTPNGWVFNAPNGGWEYPAFLALAAINQTLIGDGAFALPTRFSACSAVALSARAA